MRPQIRRDFTSGLAQGRRANPPRPRRPAGTSASEAGMHVGGGCRRSWVPPAAGGFSTACEAWRRKPHPLRRRAESPAHTAALEIPLSCLARWAGNHQLAGAKQLKAHLSNVTTSRISTDAKQMSAGSVPAATIIAEVGVRGVACNSRHRGKSAHTLPAVTVH